MDYIECKDCQDLTEHVYKEGVFVCTYCGLCGLQANGRYDDDSTEGDYELYERSTIVRKSKYDRLTHIEKLLRAGNGNITHGDMDVLYRILGDMSEVFEDKKTTFGRRNFPNVQWIAREVLMRMGYDANLLDRIGFRRLRTRSTEAKYRRLYADLDAIVSVEGYIKRGREGRRRILTSATTTLLPTHTSPLRS